MKRTPAQEEIARLLGIKEKSVFNIDAAAYYYWSARQSEETITLVKLQAAVNPILKKKENK